MDFLNFDFCQEFYNASVPISAQATFPYMFSVSKFLQVGKLYYFPGLSFNTHFILFAYGVHFYPLSDDVVMADWVI